MIRETSPANGQAQVFVSYAKLDAEQVIAMVRLLEKEGITVWRDGDRILGGQSWSEAITHAIAHSRVFLLMCSPHSLASVLTGAYSRLYASPQQMRGDDPDPRDDVYALGVIWYQLLTGDLASPAPTGRRWVDGLRRHGMSDAAIDLLSSCFESDPAHRPDDAGVLADRLQRLPRSASTKPADAATELPRREAEAPSEPVLRPAEIGCEGEAPPEPVLPPGKIRREGEAPSEPVFPSGGIGREGGAPSEPALPPGEPTPKPARTEPRPPGALRAQLVPRGRRPEAAAVSARPVPGSGWFTGSRRWVAAGLLGLAGLLGVIVYIATDKGTIKITGSDPLMTVRIDGRGYRIENLGRPITFRTGEHQLLVKREDIEFRTKSFQIRRGAETVLDVTYTEDDRSGNWPPKPPDSRPAETKLSSAIPSKPEFIAEAPKPAAAARPRDRADSPAPRRPTPNPSRPASARSSSSGFRPAHSSWGRLTGKATPTSIPSTRSGSRGRSTWALRR